MYTSWILSGEVSSPPQVNLHNKLSASFPKFSTTVSSAADARFILSAPDLAAIILPEVILGTVRAVLEFEKPDG